MGELANLLKIQAKLQERFNIISDNDIQAYINMNILSIHTELSELLQETNWKHISILYGWKQAKKNISYKKVIEELADILHFFFNIMLAFNINYDELIKAYKLKNIKNQKRWKNGY